MADLFGEWVPDEWIEEVFKACEQAPQHRYLFLTKNPQRYIDLAKTGKLPAKENMWYGSTITDGYKPMFYSKEHNCFVSIEPLLGNFEKGSRELLEDIRWVILGAMTGPGSKEQQLEGEWIENILEVADQAGVPVFMKNSFIPIVGEENMRREFPWEE